jgi:hypothetical protein
VPVEVKEWVSLLALAAVLIAVLRTYFRLEGLLTRVDTLDQWKIDMRVKSKDELDKEYADRTVVDLQFKAMKESNDRVEALVKEAKTELRDSMHALRNDLIMLYKAVLPPPPSTKL